MNEKIISDKDLKKQLIEKLNVSIQSISQYGSEGDKCFLYNCDNLAIKSHSISKQKVLSLIEDVKSGNTVILYHLDNAPQVDYENLSLSTHHESKRKLVEKGKMDSSIFFGFCNTCDSKVFELIDKLDYNNNNEINFLHALRAHSLSITKNFILNDFINQKIGPASSNINVKNLIPIEDKALLDIFDQIPDDFDLDKSNATPFLQVIQNLKLTILTKNDRDKAVTQLEEVFGDFSKEESYPIKSKKLKELLRNVIAYKNKNLTSKSLEGLDVLKVESDGKLKKIKENKQILSNALASKNFDLFSNFHFSVDGMFLIAGGFIFTLKNGNEVSLTFFPEASTNKTHFIFSEWKRVTQNSNFISILNIKTESDFKSFVSDLIFHSGSNIYFSPKYWSKIPENIQSLIVNDRKLIPLISFNLFDSIYKN